MVRRIYVEKKPGLRQEARGLLHELQTVVGVSALEDLRLLNRYDVEGLDEAAFRRAVGTVFSEPQVDDTAAALPAGDCIAFGVEPLPGQFDQRADSAAQCIQLMTQEERPTVRTARIYLLFGPLTAADVDAVKRYVLNPVECREASLDLPERLAAETAVPADVETVTGFTALDRAGLDTLLARLGLAMDLEDLSFLQAYFRDTERRDPTLTEIRVVDTYWSDHCRHTTFSTHLDHVEINDPAVQAAYNRYLAAREEVYGPEKAAQRPQTLMDIATIGAKVLKRRGLLPEIDESEEINACSIHVAAQVNGKPQDWLLMFKNETHNHPTEIEPFGGAATCIGGCIRDPLSGRAYVHQAMRLTGGDPVRQAAPAQARPDRRGGLLLLRQPDRPGHRAGQRGISPRLHRQAFGVRRGGGRRPGGECGPRTASARGRGDPAGGAHRPGRHRRRHRLLQEPQQAVSHHHGQRGPEGQCPGGAEDPAAVPGWECHPAHQAVQRLRRRRRIRGRG